MRVLLAPVPSSAIEPELSSTSASSSVFCSRTSEVAAKSSIGRTLEPLPISPAKVGKKYGLYFNWAVSFSVPLRVF